MKRLAITVIGQVQGVYFRAHTEQTAQKLGLTGFVRNQPDGSVYIEAEGEEAELQQLIAWCRDGSPDAKVQDVRHSEIEPTGSKTFVIDRG